MIGFSQDGSSFKTEKPEKNGFMTKIKLGIHTCLLLLFLLLLLFFLLIIVFLLNIFFCCSVFLPLWSLWVSSLLAWANTKPFWQSSLGSLGPFAKLFFPGSFQHL